MGQNFRHLFHSTPLPPPGGRVPHPEPQHHVALADPGGRGAVLHAHDVMAPHHPVLAHHALLRLHLQGVRHLCAPEADGAAGHPGHSAQPGAAGGLGGAKRALAIEPCQSLLLVCSCESVWLM